MLLLMRFFDVCGGSLKIDGRDCATYGFAIYAANLA